MTSESSHDVIALESALDAAQREVLGEEIEALAAQIGEPASAAAYRQLAAAVQAGSVPGEMGGRLATVLELSLASGRARRLHGAEHETALRQLFFRTAAGAGLRRHAADATAALAALAGQRLEEIRVGAPAPGTFSIELATDRCRLTIEIGRSHVTVTQLGVEM